MQDAIKAGTVLIREGAILPQALKFESESYSPGWSVQNLNGYSLDKKLHEIGWHFFYNAGECELSAFGQEGQATVHKAVERILGSLKVEKINSLEVTRVALRTFLGIPYTSVFFHTRNIQESMFLLGSELVQRWKDEQLAVA